MDEASVRTLLGQLADTEPPPARVDLDAAIAAGRRGRRWRRMRGGVLALAVAGAVAVVVAALLVVPAQRPEHQAAGATVTPARFNVLVPYASFGWLPPGFKTGAAGGTMPASTPVGLLLVAVSHGAYIELSVNPAGTCHVAGRTLPCSAYNTTNPVQSRAPDVHGHPAYWLVGKHLAWEYAPGAWSVLDWTDAKLSGASAGAQRTAMLRVAAGVRFGQSTPIKFPYWLSGLPTGWRVSEVGYTPLAGQPVVQTLRLDDYPGHVGNFIGADFDEVDVFAAPAAHSAFSCPQGTGQHVTVDGATAVLENSTAQGRDQQLCISDSHGLRVLVWLIARDNAPAPNPAGPQGVLAYARRLHLLGPDVAQWTANLLR